MTETEEINASMQRITDEAEKRRAADPDYDKKIEEARLERDRSDHRSKVYMAQNGWNAPERHLKTKVTESGPWFAKFQAIDAKLGSGFLVALVGERGNGKTQMAVNLMKSTTWSLRTARFMTAVEFFMRIK
ncbi:MAG: hypothetical protein O2931_08405, partial [Planctomycetota bacterium]|nr:hypothetical protein [Planctomycetota bacterium]